MQKRPTLRERAAFTLMELLLVMSILVIMGGMVTYAYTQFATTATMDLSATQIKMLEDACMTYKIQHLQFPQTLDDLVTPPSGMTERQWRGPYLSDGLPLDPWRSPYEYSFNEQQNIVTIRSAGPDRQMNTQDDIPDPQAG